MKKISLFYIFGTEGNLQIWISYFFKTIITDALARTAHVFFFWNQEWFLETRDWSLICQQDAPSFKYILVRKSTIENKKSGNQNLKIWNPKCRTIYYTKVEHYITQVTQKSNIILHKSRTIYYTMVEHYITGKSDIILQQDRTLYCSNVEHSITQINKYLTCHDISSFWENQ